jgi:hypothetical protein|tara:strand:+ start:295 stop:507 length:213 start_codon:yes stop_codon:yes gene_type:complete
MTELHNKRGVALRLLDEFKSWHYTRNTGVEQLLISALMKDILIGTEDDVDKLIDNLEKQNSQSLMNKLAS